MAKDWHHYLQKYIWDDAKTPYLISLAKLTQPQANNEVFLYALALSVPAALLGAAVVGHSLEHGIGKLALAGIYALSVCVAAGWLHLSKSPFAAFYSMPVPVVVLVYLLVQGFHPRLGWIDQLLIVAVLLLWLRYTFRIAAIARRYASMPDTPRRA